jgi:predicted DNA binding CopG/RHH family protein
MDKELKMTKAKDIKAPTDAWENGEYGLDEAFIKVTNAAEAAEVDGALDLKMISIRLQNDLIKKLKLIAKYHGIGYQSLIRNHLHKFVRNELLRIATELRNSEQIEKLVKTAAIHDVTSPIEDNWDAMK